MNIVDMREAEKPQSESSTLHGHVAKKLISKSCGSEFELNS